MLVTHSSKSSAAAEMGNHGHKRHQPKIGGLLCPFHGGSWVLSNTMWPGPRSTSVPSGIFIHPPVCPQYTRAKNWVQGEGAVPFFGGGAGSPSNTKSPGPRPTSIPSSIFVHPDICHNGHGPKIAGGGCSPLGVGELGPHLTQCHLC